MMDACIAYILIALSAGACIGLLVCAIVLGDRRPK